MDRNYSKVVRRAESERPKLVKGILDRHWMQLWNIDTPFAFVAWMVVKKMERPSRPFTSSQHNPPGQYGETQNVHNFSPSPSDHFPFTSVYAFNLLFNGIIIAFCTVLTEPEYTKRWALSRQLITQFTVFCVSKKGQHRTNMSHVINFFFYEY